MQRPYNALTLFFRFNSYRVEERHHAAQFRAHFFNRVILITLTHLVEVGATYCVFINPLLGKRSIFDLAENLLHLAQRFFVDDARTET